MILKFKGIMNPESDLAVISHTVSGDTSAVTNQDAVIIWGGTRNISRIDTQNGIRQINPLAPEFF
jgi:hypothetical protein